MKTYTDGFCLNVCACDGGGGGGGVGGLMMGGRLKGKKILKCRDLSIFTMCHTVKENKQSLSVSSSEHQQDTIVTNILTTDL